MKRIASYIALLALTCFLQPVLAQENRLVTSVSGERGDCGLLFPSDGTLCAFLQSDFLTGAAPLPNARSNSSYDSSRVARPKILEFYASWADTCTRLKPCIERLKQQYGDRVEFLSYDVDDPASRPLIEQYEVCPIPTVLFISARNEVVAYSVGCCSQERVMDKNISKILPIPDKSSVGGTKPAQRNPVGARPRPIVRKTASSKRLTRVDRIRGVKNLRGNKPSLCVHSIPTRSAGAKMIGLSKK